MGTVLIRLIGLDQPIVENYVGRQVPTAMVARNLERGSGFFRPQLDTAPFPNYFLVEPPVYQLAGRGLAAGRGMDAERPAGRFVSAAAMAPGRLGPVRAGPAARGRARPHWRPSLAFRSVPDHAALRPGVPARRLDAGRGARGLECWDRAGQGLGRWWLVPAWLFLAMGLAAKVTAAFVLVPLGLVILGRRNLGRMLLAVSAAGAGAPLVCLGRSPGRLRRRLAGLGGEPRDLAGGLRRLRPGEPRHPGAHRSLPAGPGVHPLGLILAAGGLPGRRARRAATGAARLWRAWGLAALATMALLAEKLHHEYYWLGLAPVVAAGLGRSLDADRQDRIACLPGSWQAFSSPRACCWHAPPGRPPRNGKDLEAAAERRPEPRPAEAWLVAVEPLLYQADRRGCRLEFTPQSAARAAAEWPGSTAEDDRGSPRPHRLLSKAGRPIRGRRRCRAAAMTGERPCIRQSGGRYKVLVDQNRVIIAELTPPEDPGHGQ